MTIQEIKKKALPILKSQGVLKAAIFGSYARGDNKKRSDIDLLVKMQKNKSGFDFLELKFNLEKNIQLQDAVIRRLEIIGEATKNLTTEFRKKHSDIPWKFMTGTRDVISHEYFGIDFIMI